MTTTTRTYRNPKTLEGAMLVTTKRGNENYTVAMYRGSEGGTPVDVYRGGVDHARLAWKTIQDDLTMKGFEIVSTVAK